MQWKNRGGKYVERKKENINKWINKEWVKSQICINWKEKKTIKRKTAQEIKYKIA